MPRCGCIFLAIVYRGLCNDPKKPSNSTYLCRGGNAFWFWTQGPFSAGGKRPVGCCPACIGPDNIDHLIPPSINIQTAPKIQDMAEKDYNGASKWVVEIPFNHFTGNDLDSFARSKLAYQLACYGGLPGMAWVWHDQIEQAEVDAEAERIHESVRTGRFLLAHDDDDDTCPLLAKIDELDARFNPTLDDAQNATEVEDEWMVVLHPDVQGPI